MEPWYRKPLNSLEFKKGLKEAEPFALTMAKVALGIEFKRGEKVESKVTAIKKEIERRKKSV